MKDAKRTLIAKIHIAKKDLAMDDATYRDVLVRVTGKDSCKKMSLAELKKVVMDMKRLGFTPKQTDQAKQEHARKPTTPKTDKPCYPKWRPSWQIRGYIGIMPMPSVRICLGQSLCIGYLLISSIKWCKP